MNSPQNPDNQPPGPEAAAQPGGGGQLEKFRLSNRWIKPSGVRDQRTFTAVPAVPAAESVEPVEPAVTTGHEVVVPELTERELTEREVGELVGELEAAEEALIREGRKAVVIVESVPRINVRVLVGTVVGEVGQVKVRVRDNRNYMIGMEVECYEEVAGVWVRPGKGPRMRGRW